MKNEKPKSSISSWMNVKDPKTLNKVFQNPFINKAFFLYRVPALAFFGVQIERLDSVGCAVRLPYSWRTQNPFQSVYFAAQAAAAELSSGLILFQTAIREPKLSMLVVSMRSDFLKKAKTSVRFECLQAAMIDEKLNLARKGEPQEFLVKVDGFNEQNEVVSQFELKWSIRFRE